MGVYKLKTVPVVIELDKKVPDATIAIHINQYNTNKQNLGEKLEMLIKKPDVNGLVTTTVLNTRLVKLRTKYRILAFRGSKETK